MNGSFKQQFIMQYLKDLAGLEGWAWKAKFQFRAMDVVGTTLDVWARVKRKIPAEGFGLVELDLGIRNLEGRESTPGTGLIALPFATARDPLPVRAAFHGPVEGRSD